MMTRPCSLRAALPTVWMSEVSLRRNPCWSASSIAMSETSGRSRPSRSRLMPTRTSNFAIRRSLIISSLSKLSMSECRYLTLMPCSCRNLVRSSAILLVSVVTRTRSFCLVVLYISPMRSSIWPSVGRTSISGSRSPVGLISCSAVTPPERFSSYSAGVAETYTVCPVSLLNSSNLSGLLSKADGSLNPYSTSDSFLEWSPLYIARS